ncbi:uncharacterized protein LOC114731157 [Neltuma alba]|uniref:uncharacterized protein LOC114731157 n=1 Tax=Neltuma alba TaxID=207710 RepID=UPI0010A2BE19|nr:uncharacterized protein LOC114731157 [Prosopis alba]
MASWSAENATKAYLSAFKMGERSKEPDVTEFISAVAAGNNAQTMVVTSASVPDSAILLAMVAAAHQTEGRVICIVGRADHLNPTKASLGNILVAGQVEFLIGEPQHLLTSSEPCKNADFVLVDCEIENHQEIFNAVCMGKKKKGSGTVVVGYNAMKYCKGTTCWGNCGTRTQLLPIGKGLLVTRFGDFGGNNDNNVIGSSKYCASGLRKFRSRWVVKVDKCTGEEHVFRVRLPHDKVVPA